MNLINSRDVIQYVKASAARAALGVVFEDENMPRHDGENIYLPRITADATPEFLQDLMASTDHEVGHDLYSDFDLLRKTELDPTKDLLGMVWNLLEDSRVNSLEADEYYGFKQLWDNSVCGKASRGIAKRAKDEGELVTLIRTLFYWDSVTNNIRFPQCAVIADTFNPDPKILDVLNTFTKRLEIARVVWNKAEGSQATLDLAKDILKALEIPETASMGKGGDEVSDEDLEEKEGVVASEKPKDEDKKDEDEKKKEPDERKKKLDFAKAKIMIEATSTLHSKEYLDDKRDRDHYDPLSGNEWYVSETVDVVDFDEPLVYPYVDCVIRENDRDDYRRATSGAVSTENFNQQIRRVLQIRAQSRYEHGVKKGKLDQSRLARICLNAPGFNQRVFKRKITSDVLNAAVCVLVDTSGSMVGKKMYFATHAALLLNESIGRALHVPLEITGFTDAYIGNPVMFLHKRYDQMKADDRLLDSFIRSMKRMYGNPDGENILWAYSRLIKRKEKKKVMIVLSDGTPDATKPQDGCAHFTHEVIKQIEAENRIDIYGIGICDHSVKRFYKHHSVITDGSQIGDKLLQVVEEKLLGIV
jgi:hypothetical protein